MPIKQAKGDKGYCDRLASKIVRSVGYCERCGANDGLTCSHIIKRRYSATRTDLENLQCLCFSCHRYFEDWPKEFSKWITDTIGSEKYEQLRDKAQNFSGRFDWQAERERLKAIAKEKGIK